MQGEQRSDGKRRDARREGMKTTKRRSDEGSRGSGDRSRELGKPASDESASVRVCELTWEAVG